MTQQFIKPAHKDLVVRRPDNLKRLCVDGEVVTWSPFWQKRLAEGSVVKAEPVPNTALKVNQDKSKSSKEVTE